ncbi:Cytochrome P450 [Niveomyces insectorum RCEF 264]|uniref:Cytochrome P450 n=1 Tax=Niveomyces insectorum RCEF 264 TaxID=1081102 RepID=A0A167LUB1_9HYPO|nr:Cytochrome P450 [Niveomyces insectorum RCEF 264]
MAVSHQAIAGLSRRLVDDVGKHAVLHPIALLVVMAAFSYFYVQQRRQKQREAALAAQYNCAPVLPFVPYTWPLALDLVVRQYAILAGARTFEELTPYVALAPTCRVHFFGLTGYSTTDPANVQAILSTRFGDYGLGSRRLAAHPLLEEGIFSQDGRAWRRSRELIRRQFARVQKQTPQAFTSLVADLVADVDRAAAVDGVVDLKPLLYAFTLRTTTTLLFGEPHSRMEADKQEEQAVRAHLDYATSVLGVRVRLADGAWLYNPPRFRRACRAVRDWAAQFVRAALACQAAVGDDAAAEKYAFILDLWRAMRDPELVRDQLLHVLVAGQDSTASLLSWTFFLLVRNPDVLERLRTEISSVPVDGDITREELQSLSFLRCCLNETLRLYPTLPMNIRFANKTTILPRGGGPDGRSPVLLLKGAGIAFSVYHLHRLESVYGPDARVYRPQRWESGELIQKARQGAGFVDFHGGPRLCLGKDFALMEASYAIVRLLQAYPTMRLAPGVPTGPVGSERQTYTIGLSPADGVRVAL